MRPVSEKQEQFLQWMHTTEGPPGEVSRTEFVELLASRGIVLMAPPHAWVSQSRHGPAVQIGWVGKWDAVVKIKFRFADGHWAICGAGKWFPDADRMVADHQMLARRRLQQAHLDVYRAGQEVLARSALKPFGTCFVKRGTDMRFVPGDGHYAQVLCSCGWCSEILPLGTEPRWCPECSKYLDPSQATVVEEYVSSLDACEAQP